LLKTTPLLSVAITTFNHQDYIEQAVMSAVNQKTSFDFEIIIGEDLSKDNTAAILDRLQKSYPDKIRILKNKENLGLRGNNINVWTACKGKYIAYLEGDDFWTDNYKLQKQVDVLEGDPSLSACFHQTFLYYSHDKKMNRLFTPNDTPKRTGFDENISKWLMATCSFVFVNFLKDPKYSDYANQFMSNRLFHSDRPLMAFVSYLGDFFYLNENMGCWRQHSSNMTKIGNLYEMYIAGGYAYSAMYHIFPEKINILSEAVIRWSLLAAEASFIRRNYKNLFIGIKYALLNIKTVLGVKNFVKSIIFIFIGKKIYS
jgi:glycosyltransferase involved in cell wall biosynthesis